MPKVCSVNGPEKASAGHTGSGGPAGHIGACRQAKARPRKSAGCSVPRAASHPEKGGMDMPNYLGRAQRTRRGPGQTTEEELWKLHTKASAKNQEGK